MSPRSPRVTKQRIAISELLDSMADFRSAQAIHVELNQAMPGIGLATVYRTLKSMVEDGLLDTFITDDGQTLYRRCSSAHHHHIVCKKCGRTSEIQAAAVESWAEQVAREHGFTDIDHMVELVGVCSNCR